MDWSLLLLFTPMWTCVVLAGTLRCITPPHPQVRHAPRHGKLLQFRQSESILHPHRSYLSFSSPCWLTFMRKGKRALSLRVYGSL